MPGLRGKGYYCKTGLETGCRKGVQDLQRLRICAEVTPVVAGLLPPEDVQEGGNSTLYIGFYLTELKMADLTNCNAASYTQWTFQEKTA